MMKLLTPRLRLREVVADDSHFLARLMNERGYLVHVGDRGVRTPSDAGRYVRSASLYRYEEGLGFNIVELRHSREPIGICGLVARDEPRIVEIGYAIAEHASAMGYASEAARAVMRHAFVQLRLSALHGVTNESNVASRRVLSKLGMTLVAIEQSGKCVYRIERWDLVRSRPERTEG